ncbi:PRC-barrel domain-containing protein [Azospirillum sp. sgz301742]
MRLRQYPRSLGLLGVALFLSAAPVSGVAVSGVAWAQQPPCPDLDRLDQRIAALEAGGTLAPPPTPAEIGGLRALRQAAVRLGQTGNADGCAVQVRKGLAMARSIEAPHAMTGKELERIKLYGAQGEDVGSIDDVMLDPASGRIAYAVVEVGGFLGLGQHKMPVPWAAFAANPNGEGLVLNVSKERLRGAPQLSGSDRPAMADRQWAMAVHTYYGVPPYWVQDATALPPAEATVGSGDAVGRLNQQVQQLSQEVTRLNQELIQARSTPPAPAPSTGTSTGSTAPDASGTGTGSSSGAPQQ